MALSKTVLALAVLCLTGSLQPMWAQQSDPLPQDRAAMTAQLIGRTKDNYAANIALLKAKPEETVSILREHWKELDDASKQDLLNAIVESENPHLLEILDLGINDSDPQVQATGNALVQNFAFRNFFIDQEGYRAWYATAKGKSLPEVMRISASAFVAHYAQIGTVEREALLRVPAAMDLRDVDGLSKVRRQALLDAGLLTAFEKELAAPLGPREEIYFRRRCLEIMMRLEADAAYIKRVAVPLIADNQPQPIRQTALALIGSVKGAWVTDLLWDKSQNSPTTGERWVAMSGMAHQEDPHLIPRFIALMEADDTPSTTMLLNAALTQLTDSRVTGRHDGVWWHTWWDRNKTTFPTDVQSIPYPKVRSLQPGDPNSLAIRRRLIQRDVDDDPQRAYWLLSPGTIRSLPAQNGTAASPQQPSFGLIVVLADAKGANEELTNFWQATVQKSLKDGYFVALPIAPRWSEHQSTLWLTQRNMAQVPEARFSTESFLNSMVADISAHYPIDPKRVWLHGFGEGGLAAYACSLSPTTPFKGFYILSSPFKTAQLPPLTGARGRHYVIQGSREDKAAPYFQAVAADDLLRKQSALVKLITIPGEQHGYPPADSARDWISQAIGWLETPH